MVYEDINMNAAWNNHENPCVDPTAIVPYTTGYSYTINSAPTYTNSINPYYYQDVSTYSTQQQPLAVPNNTQLDFQPYVDAGPAHGLPPPEPTIIRCKLFFLIAAHKNVQIGKEFVAVARITRGEDSPFVNAEGWSYHYTPDIKHPQFNTSTPLSHTELASATYDDRVFAVHKMHGSSCAPAGTYLVYRLKRTEAGVKNLRFEASWDWGPGFVGKASYDFVFMAADNECKMKPYSSLQKKLLNELWPDWKHHINP